jgi:MFS family permease
LSNSIIYSAKTGRIAVAVYAAVIAFLAYTSVYAFRKPFTVVSFGGINFVGISYPTLLIISQVMGYMLSKFYGVKLIAELKRSSRWKTGLLLVTVSWLSLLLLAIVPPPFGTICMLINGFSLGFMWGIVFSYVEGRKATDFIGAVMAVSFIFAGGFTRTAALWLKDIFNLNDYWLPFVTGAVFIIPFCLFLFLLEKIPLPDNEDIDERTERLPMDASERKKLTGQFFIGITLMVIAYFFLTIMRDIRDNYMVIMWKELGYGTQYKLYAGTESLISIIVLAIMAMMVFVRKNLLAFKLVHVIIITGFVISGIASLLFINSWINGEWWMLLTGLGLYTAYIPFNCILFERMIALFRLKGNAGFLIYVADSFGYLGSVLVMLIKEFFSINIRWSQFYSQGVIWFALLGIVCTILSLRYFINLYNGKSTGKWKIVQPSSLGQALLD